VFALIVAACLGLRAVHVLPSFSNPFAGKTTDRSQPVLLQSMRDLSRYVAADGTFQVIVDLQEDKNNVPDFLVNQRTLFVGSGTVEEYVEFGSLGGNALKVDNDKKSVQITLPPPQQSTAALDMTKSYVVAEQRGLLNRIGDAFRDDANKQQRVYQMAQQRITDAAKSSGLDQRAEANTQKMLESLFTRLGYTSVSVTFTTP
jgi:gamma-glutamylcysteine synthetase